MFKLPIWFFLIYNNIFNYKGIIYYTVIINMYISIHIQTYMLIYIIVSKLLNFSTFQNRVVTIG